MGMRAIYHMVDSIDSEIYESLEIDKSWQVIHFVLSGQKTGGQDILSNVVLKEEPNLPTDFPDFSDTEIMFWELSEIQAINHALTAVTKTWFRDRFSVEKMVKNDIYPVLPSDDNDKFFNYIYPNYEMLVKFFCKAEKNNKAIMLVIS